MSGFDERPPIPAELKRRVLVEAGHRCAIPTCRYIEVDIHHIVPWATCKSHDYDNLIALCPNCHRRADRGEIDRKSLKHYKSSLRFAHDKFSNLEIDLLFQLARLPSRSGITWPSFNYLLVSRIAEAEYISVVDHGSYMVIGAFQMNLLTLHLTEKGAEYMKDFDKE